MIRDYGVGISASDQKHIFDKFYRVSTGDLAKSTGTGLGLSLTYDMVVKGHAGSIKVDSVEGEGAEFIISLPLKVEL